MKVAIIGTGNVGSALAKGLINAGHSVTFGVRAPASFSHALIEQGVGVAAVSAAAEAAEVVIVSVPADATPAVAEAIKGSVTDQVIIDTTNVVMKGPEDYQDGFSALKEITGSEHVIKCFNSTGAENMENPTYPDTTLDMYIAGGSNKAKEVTTTLAKDIGFAEVYDFGDDSKVSLLEQFALAWINLAVFQKLGRNFGIKIHHR